MEDQFSDTEIMQCLDIIESNPSFNSADHGIKKFTRMFPGSTNAKKFIKRKNLSKAKRSNGIQFGIAPIFQQKTLQDIEEQTIGNKV